MNKSYSVTDWAMHDGDSGTDSDQNRVKIWALNLQDDNDSVDFDPEKQAKLENWPPTNDDDDEDLKQREEQSESKLFLSVDEKMKTEEEKEGMEQPGANNTSSPSPFPEEIGNPAGCVRRTLALVESLS